MYAAPAEPAEALDSSAQWLGAALAATLILPNAIMFVTMAFVMVRPNAAWMLVAIWAWAAAAYAVVAVVIVFLASIFGKRLSSERRRLLVGAAASAAVMGVLGAAWRFAAGPLPPLMLVVRNASAALVFFAAGRAVAEVCVTGFRRGLGNLTAILACVSALGGATGFLGIRIPLAGIADVGAWLGATIAMALVPRRRVEGTTAPARAPGAPARPS